MFIIVLNICSRDRFIFHPRCQRYRCNRYRTSFARFSNSKNTLYSRHASRGYRWDRRSQQWHPQRVTSC